MFTCSAGRSLFKSGDSFWAWGDKDSQENHFTIEVDEEAYIVEDEGSYHVIDLTKVNWGDLEVNNKSNVNVREILRMINKDIADGNDENIWYMTVDEFLLKHSN